MPMIQNSVLMVMHKLMMTLHHQQLLLLLVIVAGSPRVTAVGVRIDQVLVVPLLLLLVVMVDVVALV